MADVNDPKRISRSAFVRETMAAMEATAPSAEVLEQVQARKSKGNELFGRKKFPAALVEYAPLPPLPLPLLRPPPHAWPKLRAPRASPCTALPPTRYQQAAAKLAEAGAPPDAKILSNCANTKIMMRHYPEAAGRRGGCWWWRAGGLAGWRAGAELPSCRAAELPSCRAGGLADRPRT